jgi:cytochrome c oxidase assembly protein subunit 15
MSTTARPARRLSTASPRPADRVAPIWLRRMAIASLVANIAIVVTGGAVRLTGSGLGCPTWPRCTDDSFVARPELGTHGLIEYGNRLLTFVLVAVAVATLAVVWRHRPIRPRSRTFALLLFLGIPAQAVLGGITVLTDLNPWIVAGHLMLSMVLIALSVLLLRAVSGDASPTGAADAAASGLPPAAVSLAWLVYVLVWAVLYAGTVVTGSGPHAGDADAPRNGLDPAAMSQLHADLVLLLLGLTVGLVLALRALRATAGVLRAAQWLLGVELAQGLVGAAQYATELPLVLVGAHLLGAAVLVAVATWALLSVRELAGRPGT